MRCSPPRFPLWQRCLVVAGFHRDAGRLRGWGTAFRFSTGGTVSSARFGMDGDEGRSDDMTGFSARRAAIVAPVLFASALAAGCMSSPTYGTDKTANEQLVNDVSGMFALGGEKKERIDYKPRPDLVRPSSKTLPPPQQSLASADNTAWPESPEQRRARIRATATANQENPSFRPEVAPDVDPSRRAGVIVDPNARRFERPTNGTEATARQQRAEFNTRLAEQRQGSSANRKFLSEPPLAYREPAPTAAVNDVGEDEAVKERRAKSAARKTSGGGGVKSWIPWL